MKSAWSFQSLPFWGCLLLSLIPSLRAQDTVTIQSLKRVELGEKEIKLKSFYLETLYYEDTIYSLGKRTELGDQVELSASVRYNYTPTTFFRARFETFPDDNRFDNKTSRFEILGGHAYGQVDMQVDLEINTNESDGSTTTGGSSLGLDIDSEFTRLRWFLLEKPDSESDFKSTRPDQEEKSDFNISLSFYPFNFDGNVGVGFSTGHVTKLNFIEGSPTTITQNQGNLNVIQKTIPGLVLNIGDKRFNVYAGAGLATYLYPTNSDFDISYNPNANRWERKTTFGYKFGLNARSKNMRVWLATVGQSQAKETGSLLKNASSAYGLFRSHTGLVVEGEAVTSQAGREPWQLNRSGTWFERLSAPNFFPVYTDLNSNRHDWIGKRDLAVGTRLGLEVTENTIPYVSLRYQGKHFIYRNDLSAHLLRTADESQSHGGLLRTGLGTYLHFGRFVVNPDFEYRKAKNAVFNNAGDVFASQSAMLTQRQLAKFSNTDYAVRIFLTYSFDGSKPFRP